MSTPTASHPALPVVAMEAPQYIPLAGIILAQNDRILRDQAAIEELGREIRRDGQLQPGLVRKVKGDKYEVIAGERRYLACKSAELPNFWASVVEADDAKAAQLRLAENVHRQDLNPVERALAVARIYDRTTGTREQRIIATAALSAKAETWVRDNLYLANTTEHVRKLVLEGRLPATHAREIAKVADPRIQDELATRYSAGGEAGAEWSFGGGRGGTAEDEDDAANYSPGHLASLRDQVKRVMRSLAVVPWNKTTKVPGVNAPACVDCPSNSANDKMLFEHHPEPAEGERCIANDSGNLSVADGGPYCLNKGCFEQKRRAATKIMAENAKHVAKEVQTQEIPCSAKRLADNDLVPKGVDAQAFSTEVRRKVKGPGTASKVSTSESGSASAAISKPDPLEDKARRAAWEVENNWRKEIDKDIAAAFPPGHIVRVAWLIVRSSHEFDRHAGWNAPKQPAAKFTQLVDKAKSAKTLADLLALVTAAWGNEAWNSERVLMTEQDELDHAAASYVITKFGLKAGPQRDFDEIFTEKLAELRAAAKDTKPAKEKAKKKGGRK